jgi:plasmid stabilization system protein ParE
VTLRILAEAATEMDAARLYVDAQRPGLGDRFLDDLSETLAAIAEQPLIFPKLETLPDDQPFRRALLSAFRYAVVFEIVGNEIVVVAVAHTSRAPNYWLGRRL